MLDIAQDDNYDLCQQYWMQNIKYQEIIKLAANILEAISTNTDDDVIASMTDVWAKYLRQRLGAIPKEVNGE